MSSQAIFLEVGAASFSSCSGLTFLLARHLITMVPACLLGFTLAKVTLNSLIHPSMPGQAMSAGCLEIQVKLFTLTIKLFSELK